MPDAFAHAADLIDPPRPPGLDRWWSDPVAWVVDVVEFQPGDSLAPYQAGELDDLAEHGRVCVRGPRGSGKTMPAALSALWFATTRELARVDWKVPTTAGSWDQLTRYLWPEVHKWARRIRWDVLGMDPWGRGSQLLDRAVKLDHGQAFGRATDDPDLIEGAHAEHMLVIIDEGKSVPEAIWDAIEGFFSNPGEHYAFALSTPGAPVGRFYDICSAKPGYEDWKAIHVTLGQAVEAGRISEQWAEQRSRQWGEDSQPYRCHVLAEFAGAEDGVIPLAWVEAAMERWKQAEDLGRVTVVGADIGDTGDDDTVLALRAGWNITGLERYSDGDVLDHADRIERRVPKGGRAVVDSIGIGAGTLAQLRRTLDGKAVGFVASKGTKRRDRTGDFGFTNLRSAAWWNLRELLDPDLGEPVALPDDDRLLGDLTAPGWREMAGGKVQVESKDDIKKRLGRSTDAGDAVVQAFWESAAGSVLAGENLDLAEGLGQRSAAAL